jgi:hypothetical protein
MLGCHSIIQVERQEGQTRILSGVSRRARRDLARLTSISDRLLLLLPAHRPARSTGFSEAAVAAPPDGTSWELRSGASMRRSGLRD